MVTSLSKSMTDLYKTNDLELSKIPFTDFTINRKGEIFRDGVQVCKPKRKTGTLVVELPIKEDGVVYLNELKLGVLTSIVFKGAKIPWRWWKDIELFYKDDDPYNVDPANIAHQMYPEHFKYTYDGVDYKIIPNFTQYGISKEGRSYNSRTYFKTRRIGNGRSCHRGYVRLSMICDLNNLKMAIPRHRLIALCYPIKKDLNQKYGKDFNTLIVNHLNSVPGDDYVGNLEWATFRENTRHSKLTGTAVAALDIFTGNIEVYSYLTDFYTEKLNTTKISELNEKYIVSGKYRLIRHKEGVSYDKDHHIYTKLPGRGQYMKFGVAVITAPDGKEIYRGPLSEVNDRLNLGYPHKASVYRLLRKNGRCARLKDNKIHLELGIFPNYYFT